MVVKREIPNVVYALGNKRIFCPDVFYYIRRIVGVFDGFKNRVPTVVEEGVLGVWGDFLDTAGLMVVVIGDLDIWRIGHLGI